MCGIAGIFHYADGAPAGRQTLARMIGVLGHRGPDDEGFHIAGPLGLAQSRLSIIDVAGGRQPILSEDRSVAVVCNGEIYNHRELRRDLEARGHRFATRSDCEVVVHLYEEEGARCVRRLRGMFALAVADSRRRRLLLARDRVGKKPLYVADDGRRIAFASELKSLLAGGLLSGEVDPEALELYLTLGYVPAPWAVFRGAAKLPAAHLAEIDGGDAGGLRRERYWQPAFPADGEAGPERSDAEWERELEARLEEAVAVRLESEVPLGAFLSGGIDSGTVVAMMSPGPVRTHTIGFDDPALDEREDAAAVARALGTDHVASVVHADLEAVLPRIAWHLDEPFADPSAVPTWYVSRETRKRVTVALSGDGGDELFAGYPGRYGLHLLEERVRPWIPGPVRRTLLPPLARHWPRSPRLPRALRAGSVLGNLAVDADRAYFQDRSLLPPHLLDRLRGGGRGQRGFDPFVALEPHLALAPRDPLARVLYLDFATWLTDDCLVKVDRMSMAHSLEVRCPLLDQEVVELAFRVPSRLKLVPGRNPQTKVLLRRVAARRLPPEILARPKRGFAPPVGRWLREDLRDFARDLLLAPDALAADHFDRRAVARLLDDHAARRIEAGWALWTLLMLEVWQREVAREAGRAAWAAEPEEVLRAAALA